jgi:SHS2 domain-containing protein
MGLPRFEHHGTADVPIVRAYGVTHQETFENAALGVFALGWPVDAIPPRYSRPVVAPGDTLSELLVNWIDELLIMSRQEGLALSYFVVDRLEAGGVQGSAAGMPVAEVDRGNRLALRVAEPAPEIVAIPNGYWADVVVEMEPRLRLV